MFHHKRKRKLQTSTESVTESEELNPPKEKVHVTHETEEENLSQILFGDSKSFLKSLEEAVNEPQTQPNIDSGIESGTSEEDINEKKPAWNDEVDVGIDVGQALRSQKRKLPSGGINTRSNNYTSLLQHKYENIVETPSWANLKKNKTAVDSENELLQSCGFIGKSSQPVLPSGLLEFKKVRDLNSETYTEGPYINSTEFHPTSSVALVGGNRGVATLFAVDGKKNNKLHSIGFEKYPIYCAKFIKNGDEMILGSRHPYFYIYDLIVAKSLRYKLPSGITHCKNVVVSPDMQYFAVAGKWGEVHLFSTTTKDKLATLQQDGEVTALEYNSKGNLLFGHSDTGKITVWDLNMRRVKHKFIDEGCLQGTCLAASSSNQFLASGSAQGVVNLYNMEDVLQHTMPKPMKSILNLTTPISSVKFNSTSEMLALISSDIKNSIKLYHVGSQTVFSNFPSFENKLGHINAINFSPGSGFLAIGNRKSVVSLFRLKHYKSY